MTENEISTSNYPLVAKPPVVVILGHVDHGKTSLLDYIRKSHVAEKEEGGITQHIGAYYIEHKGKLITFIDTPGHEAFSAMRSRGAHVADIALLVIAAEDGLMPQTEEALSHILQAHLPYIVVINKIDQPGVNARKVRQELAQKGVLLEGMGGQVPVIETSAKSGQGIEELLEMIALVAEVEGKQVRADGPAEGVVVESFLDPHRGPSATLLVQAGKLRLYDIVATSSLWGKVKILEDFKGQELKEAGPSLATLMLGLGDIAEVGDKFVVASSPKEAEERVVKKTRKSGDAEVIAPSEGQKVLNVIVKADAHGTLEAVREILRPISNERVLLRVLQEGVGSINESDVKLAISGQAIIAGFRVGVVASAKKLSEQNKVSLNIFDVIYDLVQAVRSDAAGLLEEEVIEVPKGKVRILAVFRRERSRMIVGGKVTDGEVMRGMLARVTREGEALGEGRVAQLKIQDRAMERVAKGEEAGILFEGAARIAEGDTLELFTREKKKPDTAFMQEK